LPATDAKEARVSEQGKQGTHEDFCYFDYIYTMPF